MHNPKISSRFIIFFLALITLAISGCVSLLPEFSYQGRLLDDNGYPVPDGDYEMTYSIYHVNIGGTAIYSETQTIPVENGLFTTSIGSTPDLDPQIFAQPAWMEVAINGETLTPRQRLQGSPYAFSLAPGAVIQGEEALDRSFGGFDDTGAVVTVWNQDNSEAGGHAIFALNQAAPEGADRSITAALLAIASGGENGTGSDSGAYGAIIRSEHYRGLYSRGSENYYAAVFDSNAGIQITGGGDCNGCAIAYMGYNIGESDIMPGDFVSISGVEIDTDLNVPVMQVQKAQPGDKAVIGVATGEVKRKPISELFGAQVGGFEHVGGTAPSGGFVSVIVQGLVQANVGKMPSLELGQKLEESAVTPAIGRLMSAPDSSGLAWVMLTG